MAAFSGHKKRSLSAPFSFSFHSAFASATAASAVASASTEAFSTRTVRPEPAMTSGRR
jgi:hypothetical protein